MRLTYVSNEKDHFLFAGAASDRHAGDAPRRSRLRAVHMFVENGALASARCSFSLLAYDEHHLGSAKLSSRLRAVRILKN